jgi:hypothetical protein
MSHALRKPSSQHVRPIEVLPPMDEERQLVLIPEEVLEVLREEAPKLKHQGVSDQVEGFTH